MLRFSHQSASISGPLGVEEDRKKGERGDMDVCVGINAICF